MKWIIWKRILVGLLIVLLVVASGGLSIHFARKKARVQEAREEAIWKAEMDKRYPVKGRRTVEREAPLPPPIAEPGVAGRPSPAKRPMRIRRAEEE